MIKVNVDMTAVNKALNKLNEEVFETALMTATQEIAKELHKALLTNTPVVTGNLRAGWNSNDNLMFIVNRVSNGFQVTLINEAKSLTVKEINDARAGAKRWNTRMEKEGSNKRYSANYDKKGFMYGEAVNYGHKTPNGGWVEGRFFVEASEAQTEPLCHDIIQKNLRKYFRRWLSGK